MPSPERTFQPQSVFAPDDKTGGIPNGHQLGPPQHSPLTESASPINQALAVLKPRASALLGFPPNCSLTNSEDTQVLQPTPTVTIDVTQIRTKRREIFEQTGVYPIAAGGAPKNIEILTDELIKMYRDQRTPVDQIAKHFGVSSGVIYEKLHTIDPLNLIGTPVGERAFKRMEEEYEKSFQKWREENKEEIEKVEAETREYLRNTFGEEFLKRHDENERAINELIRKREEERTKKKRNTR